MKVTFWTGNALWLLSIWGSSTVLTAQTFSLAASQNAVTVTQGNSQNVSFTITPSGGFNGKIAFSVAGLSGCGTGTFSPQSIAAPYSGGVTLSITVANSCTPSNYNLTINGTAGASTISANVTLNVTAAAGTTPTTAEENLKNNFGFGVALGLAANVTGADIVTNATVDQNGIVRVNTRSNTAAGFLLETHYYIWPKVTPEMLNGTAPDLRSWGTGPFVAAQPGTSQIVYSVGAGWMIGFRRPKGSSPSGFGLGLGYEAIPSAQVLGSEFVNGQPAPVDSKGSPLPIRYETEDKGSLLVVLSVSF